MNPVLRIVLPLLVLAAGVLAAAGLIFTKKSPPKKPQTRAVPKVSVVTVERRAAPARIEALGTAVEARQLTLQPEVSGRVVFVHEGLVPGGTLKKGEVLVRIDAREPRLALEEAKAQVVRAEYELELERGRRRVAEREWRLVGKDRKVGAEGRALALREPHLRNAEANLEAAKARVARSELTVARTTLRAPFDVVVRDETVEIGQIVNPQSRLATLVGTDEFWVQASVPVSALRWIDTTGAGSPAQVRSTLAQDGAGPREGRVLRVLGELDPKGRMARVLVSVPDPMGLKAQGRAPILLGTYLSVTIEGRDVEDVFVVPRLALHEGDKLYVLSAKDELRIATTTPIWRGEKEIYVRGGVEDGDRVVVSRLAGPVDGMKLRTTSVKAAKTAKAPAAAEARP